MGLFFNPFSFYRLRKPRRFNHTPIYYDPRKEEQAARLRRVKREMGEPIAAEDYQPDIRGSFAEGTRHLKKSLAKGDDASARRMKNGRLLVMLVLLLFLAWFLFVR